MLRGQACVMVWTNVLTMATCMTQQRKCAMVSMQNLLIVPIVVSNKSKNCSKTFNHVFKDVFVKLPLRLFNCLNVYEAAED